jgi:hypothetical protein
MAGKEGTELGKALADLDNMTCHSCETREEPSYKATKGKEVGKAAEEVIVPMMGM